MNLEPVPRVRLKSSDEDGDEIEIIQKSKSLSGDKPQI